MFQKIFYGLRGTILKYMALVSIVPLVIGLIVVYIVTRSLILDMTNNTMQNSIHHVKRMCKIESKEVDGRLQKNLYTLFITAKNDIGKLTNIYFSKRFTTETVTNQATGEKTKIKLPVMQSNGEAFIRNFQRVDTIINNSNIKGATATIFQLFDNKLIRISTNVKKNNGKRAIMTYIPEGSSVFQKLVNGKSYTGRAIVVGKFFITKYVPIKSQKGKILGAYYVGIPTPKNAIFDMIKETKIGKEGYMYVINSQGQFIEHYERKGKSGYNLKDDQSDHYFIREMIKKKLSSVEKSQDIQYYFTDKSKKSVLKYARYSYFKEWDWIIVAYASSDDIFKEINIIFWIFIGLMIIFPIGLLLISNLISLSITKPFRKIIDTAVKVSNGDLSVFIIQKHYRKCADELNCEKVDCPAHDSTNLACWRIEGTLCENGEACESSEEKRLKYCASCKVYKKSIRNELDELIDAINNMVVTFQSIVTEIKEATEELSQDADDLNVTSHKMENESQNQAAFIEETTSANEELMASIENVAASTDHQAEKVTQTSSAMEELAASTRVVGDNSKKVYEVTEKTVTEARKTEGILKDTTNSINQISESSKKIVDIVAIINDISEQINLLSLNAAIEAARAGEHGKGFAVVSEEISKLADMTAQSTKEIETLINTSRRDVETGSSLVQQTATAITVMIKMIENVATVIGEISASADEQVKGSEIMMQDVEDINSTATQIARAASEQKNTSSEILAAISKINESIQELAGSSSKVADSSTNMKSRSEQLKDLTAIFKLER